MSTLLQHWRLLRPILVDPRLSRVDAAVAYCLLDLFNAARGAAWPSYATLSRRTGAARSTVTEAVKRLVSCGYFAVERGGGRGKSNRYLPCLEKGPAERTVSTPGKGSAYRTVSAPLKSPVGRTVSAPENGPVLRHKRSGSTPDKRSGRPDPSHLKGVNLGSQLKTRAGARAAPPVVGDGRKKREEGRPPSYLEGLSDDELASAADSLAQAVYAKRREALVAPAKAAGNIDEAARLAQHFTRTQWPRLKRLTAEIFRLWRLGVPETDVTSLLDWWFDDDAGAGQPEPPRPNGDGRAET